MPNHITNILSLSVDELEPTRLNEILAEIGSDTDEDGTMYIDFRKIIPHPDNIFTDNLGAEERKRCAEEGVPNWYDWQCENWGTKWNAYGQDIGDVAYGEVTLQFDTAWSPPIPVVNALRRKFPELHVSGHWVEEGHQSAGVF